MEATQEEKEYQELLARLQQIVNGRLCVEAYLKQTTEEKDYWRL